MQAVYVTMLGRFDILVEGKSTLSYLGKTPKGVLLLKYLLLNSDRAIPVADLVDTFWAEPDRSNPENALKTMISRLRASLTKASPLLADCIVSEKKSYRWNPDIPCEIDVFQFEALCGELEQEPDFNYEVRKKYNRVLDLHKGDLSYSASEDAIVTCSMYLHHLYLKTLYRYTALLKGDKDNDGIVHVCRVALEVDSFDEHLNLELMRALKATGQKSSALSHYRRLTDAYYKYLGIEPSESFVGFYRELIQSDLAAEASIDNVQAELRDTDERQGALVCDYYTFREIFQFQYRNMEQQKYNVFLLMVRVNMLAQKEIEPVVLDGVMKDLLEILQNDLRRGDAISRYSPTQYVLLLPMDDANSMVIITRIKQQFHQRYLEEEYRLSFQFGNILSPLNETGPR